MKRSVLLKEWMLLHPYDQADEIDQYYLRIANRIQDKFQESGATVFLDGTHSALTAARLAAWFEDIISQTGIWQAFTTECKSRYGFYLPFLEPGDDYYQDEVNIEDIQYQLWHYCQCAKLGNMVMDPWAEPFAVLAQKVYEILSAEYETAPENPRLREYLSKSYGKDGFYEFRTLIQWFHFNCYFNAENAQELNIIMQNIAQTNPDQFELFAFSETVNRSFLGGCSPLALTTPEWLRRIVKDETLKSTMDHLEARPYDSYLILEVADDFVTVEPLFNEDKTRLRIQRDSIQDDRNEDTLKAGRVIHSALVRYEGTYWQNGAMGLSDAPPNASMDGPSASTTDTDEDMTREAFLGYTGGKSYMFFKGAREANQFLRTNVPGVELRFLQAIARSKTALCLTYSQTAGMICLGDAECLRHEDNPFYAPGEQNAAKAFKFFLPNACPYDLSLQLFQDGLLDDAYFKNYKGEAQRLKTHLRFMIDYFHANYDD